VYAFVGERMVCVFMRERETDCVREGQSVWLCLLKSKGFMQCFSLPVTMTFRSL
jgi:hypothetical protein